MPQACRLAGRLAHQQTYAGWLIKIFPIYQPLDFMKCLRTYFWRLSYYLILAFSDSFKYYQMGAQQKGGWLDNLLSIVSFSQR